MGNDVTQLLNAIQGGDNEAADSLLPLVYDELRRLAAYRMNGEQPGQTLQATALVHEAYLRLVGDDAQSAPVFGGRGHFFAAAAEAMRRILVERVRARGAIKRGGDRERLELDPELLAIDRVPDEIVELDDALQQLEAVDPVKAKLVTLRFFGGLTLEEAAAALGISTTSADRYWAYARAWLFHAIECERE